jgi:chorismate mutase
MTEIDQLRHTVAELLCILVSVACAGRVTAAGDVEAARSLLIERLALMEQVAAYKWENDRPIDDPVREANVLKTTLARAQAAGLDPAVARRFIVAQMEAAKTVQRHYFTLWQGETVERSDGAADLVTELRPRIGALSADLLIAVADSRRQLQTCAAVSVLRPVPHELSDVPRAWNIAVEGVFGDRQDCP